MAAKAKIKGAHILEELKAPALIVVGMIGGNMAGKAIDKVLKVDEAQAGFNIKGMAKPVVQLTAGVSGALLLKDNNLRLVATGIAASGVASGVKVLLKKDLLAGLNGLGNSRALATVKELLKVEPYNPDLPELVSGGYETKDIEFPEDGKDYDAYEEYQEVEIL